MTVNLWRPTPEELGARLCAAYTGTRNPENPVRQGVMEWTEGPDTRIRADIVGSSVVRFVRLRGEERVGAVWDYLPLVSGRSWALWPQPCSTSSLTAPIPCLTCTSGCTPVSGR